MSAKKKFEHIAIPDLFLLGFGHGAAMTAVYVIAEEDWGDEYSAGWQAGIHARCQAITERTRRSLEKQVKRGKK